jgi:hypothetical protein
MLKASKDFLSNFVVGFAGGIIATTLFLLGRNLLVNHEFGFALILLVSIFAYTMIYAFLFAMLHIGGSATFGTTAFTAAVMVVGTNLFIYADERFATFTVGIALGQVVLALMLTAATYVYVFIDSDLALGKS